MKARFREGRVRVRKVSIFRFRASQDVFVSFKSVALHGRFARVSRFRALGLIGFSH